MRVTSLRYYVNYNESREELEVAAEEFQEGIEQWVREQLRKFFFGFIRAVIKLAFGIFPCGAAVSLDRRTQLHTQARLCDLLSIVYSTVLMFMQSSYHPMSCMF